MRIWTGKTEIDGARASSILWRRFNSKKTTTTGGTTLFRDTILENTVSCSVPASCTDRDAVKQIATKAKQQIPIESLPDVLNQHVPGSPETSGTWKSIVSFAATLFRTIHLQH